MLLMRAEEEPDREVVFSDRQSAKRRPSRSVTSGSVNTKGIKTLSPGWAACHRRRASAMSKLTPWTPSVTPPVSLSYMAFTGSLKMVSYTDFRSSSSETWLSPASAVTTSAVISAVLRSRMACRTFAYSASVSTWEASTPFVRVTPSSPISAEVSSSSVFTSAAAVSRIWRRAFSSIVTSRSQARSTPFFALAR